MPLLFVPGTEINSRFVLTENIGSGGFATVWKATDKDLNRNVALKRLLKDWNSTPQEEKARLLSEARKQVPLVHTNIVQAYDVIECEGEPLLLMEFVDGPSLYALLRDQARSGKLLPLERAVSILREILSGVSFAHDKKLVHRDLSPLNILITSTGIPKIGDFGIAKSTQVQQQASTSSSQRGTGNPDYMSPEQHRGEQADASSDLFMIGIVGYLLLTGRHPFTHPSGLFEIPDFINDNNFTPEFPKSPDTGLTQQRLFREYAAIVMRLLSREKSARYSNAREVIDALEAVTPFQECPQCGERIPEHFKFCGDCGTSLVPPASGSTATAKTSRRSEAEQFVEDGYALSLARKWPEAIALYRKAMEADPKNQKAFRNVGFALNRIGKLEEAEAVLSDGLKLESDTPPHKASLFHERAWARAELKRYPEALADVNAALRLVPFSTKSQYLRARIYLFMGEREKAESDAMDILKQIPDHTGALRVLDQLKRQ